MSSIGQPWLPVFPGVMLMSDRCPVSEEAGYFDERP